MTDKNIINLKEILSKASTTKRKTQDLQFQDKSKFVLDILEYSIKKKVDDKTKERLISLIGKEIEKTGNIGVEILERLERIEGLITTKPILKRDEKRVSSGKLHRPKETKAFLSLFNNSEGLKYLTHKFNEGKRDYKEFIGLCKKEFIEGQKHYPNVPDSVVKRIEEFTFSEKPKWYLRKGKEKMFPGKGWSEPSFIEWYNKETNTHPGLDAMWNNEMIIPFKESIEVRAGNLESIVIEAINLALGGSINSFNINKSNLDTAEFYTDVDKFKWALFHIFSTIKEKAVKNFCFEISVDYINETLDGGDFKKIVITHINSEASKRSNDDNFVKGDLKTIRNNLWGLANYTIQAKFPDGYKSKIVLTDRKEEQNLVFDANVESVRGFTHILKFY